MNRRSFLAGAGAGAAGVATAWAGVELRDREPAADEAPEWRHSYSQQGEDIVLFHALRDTLQLSSFSYLDVGAAHPVRSNNTYLLYWNGGQGVLVEPNPMFVAMLRERRPKDVVVQAGIGVTDEEAADYYEIKGNPMLNTFSREQVDALQRGKSETVVERMVRMPLVNINRVIAEHLGRAPDLLSTDIEGWDYAIIRSLDLSRFRPGVICAEGVPMLEANRLSELATYLLAQDYVVRGGSMVNTIFVDARRLLSI